ncbi:MAG TPA: type VI secretion system baseplate subunit TssE [bacterium]|nr:type VI secretion system baseplate subunit TssE [bacterium]
MATPRRLDILRHSILDRLIGDDEGPPRRTELRISVSELRNVVRRDLEWLLNTRLTFPERLEDYPETKRSILAFGLPDLSAYSLASALDSSDICRQIKVAIQTFEPRLAKRSVEVEFVPHDDLTDFSMHFRITGMIEVDPIREPVAFDTAMDRDRGTVTIQEAS